MMEENACLERLLRSRAFLYMLFYKAFARAPDADFLKLLFDPVTAERFAAFTEKAPAIPVELYKPGQVGVFTELLHKEYTRLFVGSP